MSQRHPFEVITPREPHPLTGRPVLVLPTATAASRQFIGQVVTVCEGATPGVDGRERVTITDGSTTCVCWLDDLDPDPEGTLRTSKAVSAQYPRSCPTCKAAPYRPCRSLGTGRVTDTHLARING